MPALQPPSMQIGALPPGAGPLPPSGPALAQAYQYTPPRVVQIVASATTGAAQPTSAVVNIAASQAGSLLVALIGGMAQGGTQNIPTPTNFTALPNTQGQASNTLACCIAVLANNVGGITSVTWPTLTNWSSAIMGVIEIANAGSAPNTVISAQSLSLSATTHGAFSNPYSPLLGVLAFVGLLFGNSAAVISNASTPTGAGQWIASAVQTSTNTQVSAVNTSGQVEYLLETAAGLVGIQPTVGASIATSIGVAGAGFTTLATTSAGQSSDHGVMVDNGTTAGMGGMGNDGWSLGGTKPGGAGGGQ